MKVLGVFILMMVTLSILTLCMNFIYGFDLKGAIQQWIRPLFVMGTGEKSLYILYPFVILMLPIVHFIKRKRQGKGP